MVFMDFTLSPMATLLIACMVCVFKLKINTVLQDIEMSQDMFSWRVIFIISVYYLTSWLRR